MITRSLTRGAVLLLFAAGCAHAAGPASPQRPPAAEHERAERPARAAPVDTAAARGAALREELLAMDAAEEQARSALAAEPLEGEAFEAAAARLDSLERAHARRLHEILEERGWPSAREVGGAASHAALVTVLRSRDVELQARALEALRVAHARGEAPGEGVAMLTDRLLLAEGRPQRYGTQITIDGSEITVGPLEDPHRVDELRAELGLMALEEYLDLVRGVVD